MLTLFRRNLFTNYIALLAFLVVCLMPYVFGHHLLSIQSLDLPFNDVLAWRLPYSQHPLMQCVYALVIIYLEALLIAETVIQNRLSRLLSIIPAAVFVLFCLWALNDSVVHTVLIANLFAILSIRSLFNIYKKYKPIAVLFNAGFFLGIATIFYLPFIFYFVPAIFALIALRSLNPKEFLQMAFGFMCPLFLIWTVLFYKGNTEVFWNHFDFAFYLPELSSLNIPQSIKMAVLFISLLFLIIRHTELLKKKTFDAIKKIELSYWFLLLAFVSCFFTGEFGRYHLVMISAPLSIIGGLYLENKQNSTAKEFIFLLYFIYFMLIALDII